MTHSIPTTPTTVDVVLPCLDEALALPWVLGRIPAGWRAIVVDNGSADGSAEIAAGLGATVVREPRRGFGAACHAGLLAAEAEFVCFCDCDASLDPGLLPAFVAEVAAGRADLVLGRRRPRPRTAWPLHARAGNLALARMMRRRTGLRLHDLGPLRATRREPLLALSLTDRRSGYPLQMVVRAADAGWRVTERDVPYLPRRGKSKVTGTWRGTWQAVHDMQAVLAQPPVAADHPGAAGTAAPAGPERTAHRPAAANGAARTAADPTDPTDPTGIGTAEAAPFGAQNTDHARAGRTAAPQPAADHVEADRTAHRSADTHDAARRAAAPPAAVTYQVDTGPPATAAVVDATAEPSGTNGPVADDRTGPGRATAGSPTGSPTGTGQVDAGPTATVAVVEAASDPSGTNGPVADDRGDANRTTSAPPTASPGGSRVGAGSATAVPPTGNPSGTDPAGSRPGAPGGDSPSGAGRAGTPHLGAL